MNLWVVDANNIRDVSDEDLVVTPAIKEFISPTGRESIYFIVAPKGLGKTLLLMYKRYLYQRKHKWDLEQEDIIFIPNDTPVDRNIRSILLGYDMLHFLEKIDNWVNIWYLCITLSIIKNLKINYERKGSNEIKEEFYALIGHLPTEIQDFIEEPLVVTPYGYLNMILQLGPKNLFRVFKRHYLLTEIIKWIRSGVAIFIDNTDECFGEHLKQKYTDSFSGKISPGVWYAAQIGLMGAIWLLTTINHHLKIFASIRKEAYLKLLMTDERGLQMMGSALDISYSKAELKEIVIKNIKGMRKSDLTAPDFIESDPFHAFLGLEGNVITNALVGNKEDIFDYIYRHTLKRPRDLMLVGRELTNVGVTERTEENIRSVIERVATTIAYTYIKEMEPHLEFNQFGELFDLIHSNILTGEEVREICRDFNMEDTCENKDCKLCEKTPVFYNLYKIGLLGLVDQDPLTGVIFQRFEKPGTRTFESNMLPQSDFYIIHPVLSALIPERKKMLGSGRYDLNPQVIIGDKRPWGFPRIYRTTRYCSFINQICNTDRFLNKRGVFLASSYNKRGVMEELSEKLRELNLPLDIDKLSRRETPENGAIFCDEVCPKIFRNLWMLAEVSDFNPNVFFECGFALGLGRKVILLCDEKAELIKSKIGEQLYLSYKTVDEIPIKLGWNLDKLNDIKINDLYLVPRYFKYIDNFDSPSDREKNNEVFVLSFNQEVDMVRILSERYGYKIVGLNRLNKVFLPEELVEDLIKAQTVLINLSGVQREQTMDKIHDAQLMCLAGICVSQGVPVKIFQSNTNIYSDVPTLCVFSEKPIVDYVNSIEIR